jgi:hypothetical protein
LTRESSVGPEALKIVGVRERQVNADHNRVDAHKWEHGALLSTKQGTS